MNEGMAWERGRAVLFLGKFVSNFGYSADRFDFWGQVRIDLVLSKGLGRFFIAPS